MLLLALATVTTEHSTVPTNHRCTATTCAFTPEMFKHATALNTGTSAVYLYWSLSQDNDEIAIGVDAHDTRGWVAVGISANGGMMGADIWRLSKDGGGNLKLDDMFVEGWVTPRLATLSRTSSCRARSRPMGARRSGSRARCARVTVAACAGPPTGLQRTSISSAWAVTATPTST